MGIPPPILAEADIKWETCANAPAMKKRVEIGSITTAHACSGKSIIETIAWEGITIVGRRSKHAASHGGTTT